MIAKVESPEGKVPLKGEKRSEPTHYDNPNSPTSALSFVEEKISSSFTDRNGVSFLAEKFLPESYENNNTFRQDGELSHEIVDNGIRPTCLFKRQDADNDLDIPGSSTMKLEVSHSLLESNKMERLSLTETFTELNDDNSRPSLLRRQDAEKNLSIPASPTQELEVKCLQQESNEFRGRLSLSLTKQVGKKNLNPELERQSNFKLEEKIPQMMKGASALEFAELLKYDTNEVVDPNAAPSQKVKKSSLKCSIKSNAVTEGDGDVWVEKIRYTKNDRQPVTCFVSKATGKIVRNEPPTGASKVIFLKDSTF
jgi:hypothetical protein